MSTAMKGRKVRSHIRALVLLKALFTIPVKFQIVADDMEVAFGDRRKDVLKRAVLNRKHRMTPDADRIMRMLVAIQRIDCHRAVRRQRFLYDILFYERLQNAIYG